MMQHSHYSSYIVTISDVDQRKTISDVDQRKTAKKTCTIIMYKNAKLNDRCRGVNNWQKFLTIKYNKLELN